MTRSFDIVPAWEWGNQWPMQLVACLWQTLCVPWCNFSRVYRKMYNFLLPKYFIDKNIDRVDDITKKVGKMLMSSWSGIEAAGWSSGRIPAKASQNVCHPCLGVSHVAIMMMFPIFMMECMFYHFIHGNKDLNSAEGPWFEPHVGSPRIFKIDFHQQKPGSLSITPVLLTWHHSEFFFF